MKQLIPTIWLDDTASDAADFYSSVFENTEITHTTAYPEAGKEIHEHEPGSTQTVSITIEGQPFVLLNGGPIFKVTPATSFTIASNDPDEIQRLWDALSEGGSSLMPLDKYPFSEKYGWLNDKFGVSWQLNVVEGEVPQKVIPSFLFTQAMAGKAEEAMHFYTDIFPNSSIVTTAYYGPDQAPNKEGTVTYGEFKLSGYTLIAMDSALNHEFTFTPGVSLTVLCETQEEIDHYWNAMSAVPEAEACGWLQDKYGVSWQITPTKLNEYLENGTPAQIERVTDAFMKMKKLDLAALERAYKEV